VDITEVRIKLMEEAGERLQAFCSITFDDCFVIRDLKIIEGTSGPFVAMPSRKLTSHCPQCRSKNHLRAAYCNQCGARLKDDRATRDEDGRAKLYADIAHPINSNCREMIQDRVIREFYVELDRAKQPGYVSRYDDIDGDDSTTHAHPAHPAAVPQAHYRVAAATPPAHPPATQPQTPQPHAGQPRTASREAAIHETTGGEKPAHEVPARADRGASRDGVRIQPAEPHPRGPHRQSSLPSTTAAGSEAAPSKPQSANHAAKAPATEPSAKPAESSRAGTQDAFGAGIF
jgi:stage V sporulation protein G